MGNLAIRNVYGEGPPNPFDNCAVEFITGLHMVSVNRGSIAFDHFGHQEANRYFSTPRLGFFRMACEDVIYNGQYKIPMDTITAVNVYAVNRDRKVYSRPEEFAPERWMSEHRDKWLPSEAKDEVKLGVPHLTFGCGRRVWVNQSSCQSAALCRPCMPDIHLSFRACTPRSNCERRYVPGIPLKCGSRMQPCRSPTGRCVRSV